MKEHNYDYSCKIRSLLKLQAPEGPERVNLMFWLAVTDSCPVVVQCDAFANQLERR